jgi:hypothetical protein
MFRIKRSFTGRRTVRGSLLGIRTSWLDCSRSTSGTRITPLLLDRFFNKLNLYGFKKVYQDGDEECFKNRFFLKGQVGLLALIKRSKGGERVLTKDPIKKNGMDSL